MPFRADQAEMWFRYAEVKFFLCDIKDDLTKYNCIVKSLSLRQIDEVADIIQHPPETNRYDTLKRAIFRRLAVSQSQKTQEKDMGNRTPSQFLRYIRTQAGEGVSDEFLRTLWTNRLPSKTRAIVAASNAPLDELAAIADHIHETAQRTATYLWSGTSFTQEDRRDDGTDGRDVEEN
ncbi:hypothetical protein WN51_12308 [Melipona quadrifasciata]|uniref:DUF7041 domain-containing protein n=1 Tax=Melipona quadrifasciata TaxID=166423 RepID=A0A0M9ABX3_9HYME|nr:hypothetical protein WN51_12308 [Melipona quadrifasciata]